MVSAVEMENFLTSGDGLPLKVKGQVGVELGIHPVELKQMDFTVKYDIIVFLNKLYMFIV